jgi:hypothetical protein
VKWSGGSSTIVYTVLLQVGLADRAALRLTGTSGPSGLPPSGAVSGTLAVSGARLAITLQSWVDPYNAEKMTREAATKQMRSRHRRRAPDAL